MWNDLSKLFALENRVAFLVICALLAVVVIGGLGALFFTASIGCPLEYEFGPGGFKVKTGTCK